MAFATQPHGITVKKLQSIFLVVEFVIKSLIATTEMMKAKKSAQ